MRGAAAGLGLLGMSVGLWSCVAAASAPIVASAGMTALQTGSAAFINGQLESACVVPLERMYQIVLDTVHDLNFPVSYQTLGPRTAYVYVHETSGREIKFYLEQRSTIVTKLNIRVGMWGDQAISRLLLEEVQARSPAVPPPASVPLQEPPPGP